MVLVVRESHPTAEDTGSSVGTTDNPHGQNWERRDTGGTEYL